MSNAYKQMFIKAKLSLNYQVKQNDSSCKTLYCFKFEEKSNMPGFLWLKDRPLYIVLGVYNTK